MLANSIQNSALSMQSAPGGKCGRKCGEGGMISSGSTGLRLFVGPWSVHRATLGQSIQQGLRQTSPKSPSHPKSPWIHGWLVCINHPQMVGLLALGCLNFVGNESMNDGIYIYIPYHYYQTISIPIPSSCFDIYYRDINHISLICAYLILFQLFSG